MARKLPTVWVAFSGNVSHTEVEIADGTKRDPGGEHGMVGVAGGTNDPELCLPNL